MPQPIPEANDKIAFYFTPPMVPVAAHLKDGKGKASVLYLLRRELIETSGHDPNTVDEATVVATGATNRLFATLILAFTVIDLLAKFVSTKTRVGDRFCEFLESSDGGQQDPDNAKMLWEARNSLVHQFNVPPEEKLKSLRLKYVSFAHRSETTLRTGKAQTITGRLGDVAIVYVDGVLALTFSAIRNYEDSLYGSESEAARQAFLVAFEEYGQIVMDMRGTP